MKSSISPDPLLPTQSEGAEATATTAMVQLTGVTKKYPHFELQPIDLELPAGTVMGLIGPNGAGKSTIMRIMMGLVNPNSGSVQVLGQSMSSNASIV